MTGRGAWGVGAWVVLGVGAVLWAAVARVTPALSEEQSVVRPAPEHRPASYPADSLGRLMTMRPVFRATRRPAVLPYDPQRAGVPETPPLPKPSLTLVGLVAGAEPSAVIEGLPGVDGSRVVRTGDVVSGLRVKRIEGDRVVIVGMDTTWVLKVREPWKP